MKTGMMGMLGIFRSACVMIMGLGMTATAGIYVSPHGNHSTGADWANAFTNLQTALNAATHGATIYLAGHTFQITESLQWEKLENVQILGGYEADPETVGPGDYDSETWPTVIRRAEGAGNIRILRVLGVTNSLLGRVTIADGYLSEDTARGGGMYIQDSILDIVNCVTSNNQAHSTGNNNLVWGGGVYAVDSTVTFERTLFLDNTARRGFGMSRSYGGGLSALRCAIHVLDCRFIGNTADNRWDYGARGGAIYLRNGISGVIESSVFERNNAGSFTDNRGRGGAIYLYSGTLVTGCTLISNRSWSATSGGGGAIYMEGGTVRNSLLAHNQSTRDGGGIYAAGGIIENVTVTGNHSDNAGTVAGVYLSGGTTVTNAIFYANYRTIDGQDTSVSAAGGTVGYSLTHPLRAGTGNLAVDPEFWNAAGGDYRLLPGSPAIDSGFELAWMDGALDLAGHPRIRNGVPDMGALESDPPNEGPLRANFIADRRQGFDALEVVLTAFVDGENTGGLTYHWDFENTGDYDLTGSEYDEVTHTYGPGVHTVRLRVTNGAAEQDERIKTAYITVWRSEIYVGSGGNDSDGSSWANAFHTLQQAIDSAAVSNTIYVAGETFELNEPLLWQGHDRVHILGGYEANPATIGPGDYDSERWPTVIRRAGNAGYMRVLAMIGLTDAVLARVTLADGHAYTTSGSMTAGGLLIQGSSVEIVDCVVSNNTSEATSNDSAWGAGMHVDQSDVILRRTWLIGNTVLGGWGYGSARGGGISAVNDSTVSVLECVFVDNKADARGYLNSEGGALYMSGGDGIIRNTLIYDNRAGAPSHLRGLGGGIYLEGGNPRLENVTIAHNKVWNSGTTAAGFYISGGGAVTNTIIYFNTNVTAAAASDVYTDNLNRFGWSCAPELTNVENYNIIDNPMFVDGAARNYRLLHDSPCVDSGVLLGWMVGATDIDGVPRVLWGKPLMHGGTRPCLPDRGAYETIPRAGLMITIP